MSSRSVKTGKFSRKMLVGNTFYDPAAYYLIERQTLSSDTALLTFSSIPQTYQHLQLRVLGRSSTIANSILAIRFNSDTGSNYANHRLGGNGSTASASNATAETYCKTYWIPASDWTAGQFGVSIIDIHDYTSTTKNKTVRALTGRDQNGGGEISLTSSLWLSTSAITSISLLLDTGASFISSSTFALYSIKGA